MAPVKPDAVCDFCWRTWHTRGELADAIGYCWHRRTAWRVKPSGEVITVTATVDEVHAMRARLQP